MNPFPVLFQGKEKFYKSLYPAGKTLRCKDEEQVRQIQN